MLIKIEYQHIFLSNNLKTITNKILTMSVSTWIQKYRPKTLDDIISQDEPIKILKNTARTGEMPHFIIYGNSGIGKTTAISALCHQLFGPRRYHEHVLELNASDERGIGVVRDKIIKFAKLAIGTRDPRYLCPDYNVIVLDEADAMTKEAQSALRKVIEERSKTTRFVLICNYINQIIEPINSRCVKLKFKPISTEDIIKKLYSIAINEKINITLDALKGISDIANGDMRKSILILQNVKYRQFEMNGNPVTKIFIYDMCNFMTQETANKILKTLKMKESHNILVLMDIAKNISKQGFIFSSIMLNVINYVVEDDELLDDRKAKIIFEMSNIEKYLNQRASEYVQLLKIITCFTNAY